MANRKLGSADAVLEIGNRLVQGPSERLIASAFAEEVAAQSDLESKIGLVDLAHCITMAEQGAIPFEKARKLIAALLVLQTKSAGFTIDPALGDLYTNREAQLAQLTDAVGWLGMSRPRREALTTAYHLLMCDRLHELGGALIGFARSIASVADAHVVSFMPDYTYLQSAQPTSFGHYLSGFAWPALRDLQRLKTLYARADLCPAGAGSMNGSVAFQDRVTLAGRLGFAGPVTHARDAMWQADLAIEAMSLAVTIVVGLDRLAEDLMIFATSEFGFVHLADQHARASKIMPQKRNPYALAFVRGLANRLIGELTGVAASGRTPSGQLDNRTLPYAVVPAALQDAARAAALMAEVVTALTFDARRAREILDSSQCCAADLAERLCLGIGLSFRDAHSLVARLIGRLEAEGRTFSSVTEEELTAACREYPSAALPLGESILKSALDPIACLEARRDVGGAAPEETRRQIHAVYETLRQHDEWLEAAQRCHKSAADHLLIEAQSLAGDLA